MKSVRLLSLVAGLALLAPGVTEAQTQYKIQPILKVGDTAGDIIIATDQLGIFFLGRDGKLQAVAVPDQELPDSRKLHAAAFPHLNDAGMIVFPAWRFPVGSDGDEPSGYLWENGTLTLIAKVNQAAPGGGTFASVQPVKLNNMDRSVLVDVRLGGSTRHRLYRFSQGQGTLVLAPRQEMPGGGTFQEITGLSDAEDAGRHVFTATLEGKSTGLYLLELDGKLTLLLKRGTTTELGTITQIGQRLTPQGPRGSIGAALNNKGQIVVPVKFDNGPDTVVLLTPTTP